MIRKPQKIFAHLELLPKADCKFGVRVRKLTALSEDGREFYALPDQAHYQESVRKVRSDFLAFCRACGVGFRQGEVWVTESVSRDAGAVLPCPDCPQRGCMHIFVGFMGIHDVNMRSLAYEYELFSFHLPAKEDFSDFCRRCGYSEKEEPYAGRALYRSYRAEIDKDKFSFEECERMEKFILAHAGCVFQKDMEEWKKRLTLREALLRLYRDAPSLFARAVNALFAGTAQRDPDAQGAAYDFWKSLLQKYDDRTDESGCFPRDVWTNGLARFLYEQLGEEFCAWAEEQRRKLASL